MCDIQPDGFLDPGGFLIQYGFWALFVLLQIGLGRAWTDRGLYTDKIKRPASPLLRPPPWLFGVVWSVLYLGQSVAAYYDVAHVSCGLHSAAVWLYVAYAAVSTAWTYVFFARRAFGAGFAVILVALGLAVATAATYIYEWVEHDNWVSWWCFGPTAVWLGYATLLNLSIWRLNRSQDDLEVGRSACRLRAPKPKPCEKRGAIVDVLLAYLNSESEAEE